MNDRERIASIIQTYAEQLTAKPHVATDQMTHGPAPRDYSVADAVLAALGDRLLPEVPEWVEQCHVAMWNTKFEDAEVVSGALPRRVDMSRAITGNGNNIPDAIHNALESDHGS